MFFLPLGVAQRNRERETVFQFSILDSPASWTELSGDVVGRSDSLTDVQLIRNTHLCRRTYSVNLDDDRLSFCLESVAVNLCP